MTALCISARPISDRIVVKRDKADDVTAGGIVLPENSKDKPTQGTVVAVGRGRMLPDGTVAEMEIQEGDSVMFGAYKGSEVEIDDEKFVVMHESDVMLVIS